MFILLKRFLAWGFLACLPLVFSACGGGGGGSSTPVPTTTVSGIATKGPIKGALVEVFQLLPNGSPGQLAGSGISAGDGSYAIEIPVTLATPPLLVKVTGQSGAQYTSESTNLPVAFSSAETFYAVVDKLAAGQLIAVSPLSDAGYKNLQQTLTADPLLIADTQTVAAVNAYVASLYHVTDLLANPAATANVANLAALTVIDQMVVNANTGSTLQVTNMISQAVADVNSTAYQTYLTALTQASNQVLAATPPTAPLAGAVQSLVTAAATPPANPDFGDSIPPSIPLNLMIKGSTLTSSTAAAELSWTASIDNNAVTGYDIYRDGSKIATVKTAGYSDSSLLPGATYTYYVQAFDAAGNRSVISNTASVTPVPVNLNVTVNGQISSGILNLPAIYDLTPPSAPTNLTAVTAAVSAATSSVTLAWNPATDNKGITGYDVLRNGSKIATVSTVGYIDAAVTSGAAYTYALIAFDAAGNRSPASSSITVTPPSVNLNITVNGQISGEIIKLPAVNDLSAPTAPTNLNAATSSLTANTSSVALSWAASSDNVGVTGYDIYRDGIKRGTVPSTGFIDSPVASASTYVYHLVAVDAAGNRSANSNTVSVTPPAANLSITVNGQVSSSIIGF